MVVRALHWLIPLPCSHKTRPNHVQPSAVAQGLDFFLGVTPVPDEELFGEFSSLGKLFFSVNDSRRAVDEAVVGDKYVARFFHCVAWRERQQLVGIRVD